MGKRVVWGNQGPGLLGNEQGNFFSAMPFPSHRALVAYTAAGVACLRLVAASSAGNAAASSESCRSPLVSPFNASSIWNTGLGGGAVFGETGLFPADGSNASAFYNLGIDEMVFLAATGADPLVPWYAQGHWGPPDTPAAYCNVTGPLLQYLNVPSNFTSVSFGGNNAVSFLQPDGETIVTAQPVYCCEPGAPILALPPPAGEKSSNIVTDDGRLGGHGGSGLSSLGGALRRGEMLPAAPPIAHSLQLEFYAHLFYYLPPNGNHSECFSWPANTCDGYAFAPCAQNPGCYGGVVPAMRPGALLAVPAAGVPALNASLATAPAKRLLAALATYGAYVVDDTYWNATGITAEVGVREEFRSAYGFDMNTTATQRGAAGLWYGDFLALMRALKVVTNNAPQTQGGGGAPLAPPPLPFCPPT